VSASKPMHYDYRFWKQSIMNRRVSVMTPGGDGVQSLTQPARQTVASDAYTRRRARSELSEAVGLLKHS
jgi:hypothetical protein